jgi:hypothetical protein
MRPEQRIQQVGVARLATADASGLLDHAEVVERDGGTLVLDDQEFPSVRLKLRYSLPPPAPSRVTMSRRFVGVYYSSDEQVEQHRKEHREYEGEQYHHEASEPAAERADLNAPYTHEMLSLAL